MTTIVGPGKQRNKVFAVCVAVVGAFPLFLGISVLWITGAKELTFAAVFLLPGIGLLGWAFWLWRKPQVRGASVEFNDTGFTLSRLCDGDAVPETELNWRDVRELREVSGGYGMRRMELLLTHVAAQKAGLVLDSTRETAFDILVKRKIVVNAYEVALPISEVVACCLREAKAAGCSVEKAPSRNYLVVLVQRWLINQT